MHLHDSVCHGGTNMQKMQVSMLVTVHRGLGILG